MDDGRVVAQERCAALLPALSEERRELFALRLDRWWPDLVEGLTTVYGTEQTQIRGAGRRRESLVAAV